MVEELPDLAELKARRRLVEDDEPAPLPERAGDLEELLLADGQPAGELIDVDGEAPDIELPPPEPADFAPIDRSKARSRLVVQKQVLPDREVGDER